MRNLSYIIILFLIFSVLPVMGEGLPDYEPYEEDEFPGWALNLRRGEVIFFGTIPFTFFISNLSYDIYQYASNNFDSNFAPALFGNTTPPILTNTEKLQIIAVSVSLSGILTIVDYLLGEPWND
ncbi:MAG: hypothetical protein KAH95_08195 [Spirochaetales bacterium]|nr:hypothetical protein [Spirochaetales bacterium]